MNSSIDSTITEVRERLIRCQDLLTALHKFQEMFPEREALPAREYQTVYQVKPGSLDVPRRTKREGEPANGGGGKVGGGRRSATSPTKTRTGLFCDAVRAAIAAVNGPFTRADLQAVMNPDFPELVKAGKLTTKICQNLFQMLDRGEFSRKGHASSAVYTVVKLDLRRRRAPAVRRPKGEPANGGGGKVGGGRRSATSPTRNEPLLPGDLEDDGKPIPPPSAKELAYRQVRGEICVPRDPEVQSEE